VRACREGSSGDVGDDPVGDEFELDLLPVSSAACEGDEHHAVGCCGERSEPHPRLGLFADPESRPNVRAPRVALLPQLGVDVPRVVVNVASFDNTRKP
jgi:hypothetical protein